MLVLHVLLFDTLWQSLADCTCKCMCTGDVDDQISFLQMSYFNVHAAEHSAVHVEWLTTRGSAGKTSIAPTGKISLVANLSILESDLAYGSNLLEKDSAVEQYKVKEGGLAEEVNENSGAVGWPAIRDLAFVAGATNKSRQSNPFSGLINGIGNIVNTVGNAITDAADSVGNAVSHASVDIAAPLVTLPGQLTPGEEISLGGHSLRVNNILLCVILAFLVGSAMVGWRMEREYARSRRGSDRASPLLLAMLMASYVLLIPGLCATLFSFNVVVEALGKRISLTTDASMHASPITESTLGLIMLLWTTGSVLGAILVILYAVIVPVAKLGLLMLGERWRHSGNAVSVMRAQWCIRIVQYVSKWASPDMFAYILLLYLVRMLDSRPTIQTDAQLDVGFACFSIFCVGSTVSSLAIHVPGGEEPHTTDVALSAGVSGLRQPWLRLLAGFLFTSFFIMLGLGLAEPCMSLHVEAEQLLETLTVPGAIEWLVDPAIKDILADLSSNAHASVSPVHCIRQLLHWISEMGDYNCVFAFLMLAGFAIAMPVLNVTLLAVAYLQLQGKGSSTLKFVLSATKVLKHVAMLDVFIMGVVVVGYAGAIYKAQGVALSLERGLLKLAAAEVIHYVLYYYLWWRIDTSTAATALPAQPIVPARDPLPPVAVKRIRLPTQPTGGSALPASGARRYASRTA